MSWEKIKLGELITLKRGYDLPAAKRQAGEVPIVSSSGKSGFHNVAKVSGPGVVTGRYGTLGKIFFIKEAFWPLNTSLYVQDFKGNNPRFIAYFLKSVLSGTTSDKAAVPGVNRNDLHAREVKTTRDVVLQQLIVSVLSAYDDLIENNRRRIQLLEESARLLYREWFVRLRFPGHEHVKVVDGVPEGWEKKHISEVCETVGGGTPKTKVPEYWGDEITWVVPTDVTRNNCLYLMSSARMITEKGLKESSAKMVPPYTILMTSRASVGFFALMDHDVCTNQGFINIVPKRFEQKMYYLFNLMSRVEEIRGNAKGTTYPEISKGRFRSMEIVIPSRAIIVEFCTYAENIFKQICCLKKQIENTSRARDLLLPRLMNGEVAV